MTTEIKDTISNMGIIADTKPLLLFIKLLDIVLQSSNRPFDISDFSFELARIETDFSATGTGKLTVILYPSDAFLRFAGTSFTGDFNLCTIEGTCH